MRVLYLTINPNRLSTTAPTEGGFVRERRPVVSGSCVRNVGRFSRLGGWAGNPVLSKSFIDTSKYFPWPFVRSMMHLASIVRKHQIDIIHCNEQNCYPIGAYLARWTRLPVVVSVHFTMGRDFCSWAFGKRTPTEFSSFPKAIETIVAPVCRGLFPNPNGVF